MVPPPEFDQLPPEVQELLRQAVEPASVTADFCPEGCCYTVQIQSVKKTVLSISTILGALNLEMVNLINHRVAKDVLDRHAWAPKRREPEKPKEPPAPGPEGIMGSTP